MRGWVAPEAAGGSGLGEPGSGDVDGQVAHEGNDGLDVNEVV